MGSKNVNALSLSHFHSSRLKNGCLNVEVNMRRQQQKQPEEGLPKKPKVEGQPGSPVAMSQYGKTMKFLVNGQGTFLLNERVKDRLEIYVSQEYIKESTEVKRPLSYIKLELVKGEARFLMKTEGKDDEKELVKKVVTPNGKNPGLAHDVDGREVLTTYWYSYDRDACTVKYGKGYVMGQTTIMTWDFLAGLTEKEEAKMRKDLKFFFSPSVPCYVMVFTEMMLRQYKIDSDKVMGFMQNPLAGNKPPTVQDSNTVTLFDLDLGKFTFSESLPAACRELYFNIRNCELNYPEITKYKLSDAIRYSLTTEGMFLWNIKKSKEEEFGDDPKMVYIRVTLGEDVRSGPGVPYVLEIWPSGCYSPIHNHGGACAVIKVLHGQIDILVHNKETNPPNVEDDYLFTFTAKEGDFTWMDENWYQSHQLKNTTDDYCGTIQCYRYSQFDGVHWPGFDYPSDENELHTFFPNSDVTFIKMRNIVMDEYSKHMEEQKKK